MATPLDFEHPLALRSRSLEVNLSNASQSEEADRQDSPFDFMGLPLELRRKIYEYALPYRQLTKKEVAREVARGFYSLNRRVGSWRTRGLDYFTPNLLLVSRQIHQEALQILQSKTVLCVDMDPEEFLTLVSSLRKGKRTRQSSRINNYYSEDQVFEDIANFQKVYISIDLDQEQTIRILGDFVRALLKHRAQKTGCRTHLTIDFRRIQWFSSAQCNRYAKFFESMKKLLPQKGVEVCVAYQKPLNLVNLSGLPLQIWFPEQLDELSKLRGFTSKQIDNQIGLLHSHERMREIYGWPQ